jgi:hypothetical protein
MRAIVCLGLVFIFISLSACLSMPVVAADSWTVDTVAESVWVGGSTPLAIDSNGVAHLAYPAPYADGIDVTYISRSGDNWTRQTVNTGDYGFKKILDLKLDANNNPWLLFATHFGGQLGVSRWNGTGWSIYFYGELSGDASIAFDSSNKPHVAYATTYKENPRAKEVNALKYDSWSGTEWTTQLVGTDMNSTFTSVSLAIDKNDKPYILSRLRLVDNGTVKLFTSQNSNWATIIPPLPQETSGVANIAIDSLGNIHFVCNQRYLDESSSAYRDKLLYISQTGGNWDTQTVVTNVWLDGFNNLVLDKQDNPHFTYGRQGEGRYVTQTSSGDWKDLALPQDIKAGSLGIDQYGNLHLSSRANGVGRYLTDLVYASGPADWSVAAVGESQGPFNLELFVGIVVFFVTVGSAAVIYSKRKTAKKTAEDTA